MKTTKTERYLIEQYRELVNWLDTECPKVVPPLEPYTTADLSSNFVELLRIRLDEIDLIRTKLIKQNEKTISNLRSRNPIIL